MSLDARLLECLAVGLEQAPSPLFLGLSGGMDSMLLLEACHRLQLAVTAIHVHHGLQADADAWTVFCRSQCELRSIPLVCRQVQLSAGGNIEARAREARYGVFAEQVGAGGLLLAQHQDDQAETFVLRLMRAAGAQGLAGMAPIRQQGEMTLLRPLLDFSRAELARLANAWQLAWVEDPSNQNPRFERNWVRQQLLPTWQAQQPDIKRQLAQSASHLAEAAQLLDELAVQDLAVQADGKPGLNLAALSDLSQARRHNLLRYWLGDKETYRPGADVLGRIEQEVLAAACDRQPMLRLSNGLVTRYRARLYWLPHSVFTPAPAAQDWLLAQPLQLGQLELVVTPQEQLSACCDQADAATERSMTELAASYNRGLGCVSSSCAPLCQEPSSCAPLGIAGSPLSGQLHLPASLTSVRVAFAQGGERILRNGRHQQVSECWRAAGIAPWLRRWLPLFYVGDELVAAAAICVADNWQAQADAALRLSWQLPSQFAGV